MCVLFFDAPSCPYLLFQILTKDSVTVKVDAVVFFRIYNPTMSIINVQNAASSTYLVAQTTLRNVLGSKKMSEVLSDREAISEEMQVRIGAREENFPMA